jgi:hypothetical protein
MNLQKAIALVHQRGDRLVDCDCGAHWASLVPLPRQKRSWSPTDSPIVQPALQWLRSYWVDWALVTGTWYNLWALLCSYPAEIGLSDAQYRRGYAKALDWPPHLDAQRSHGC